MSDERELRYFGGTQDVLPTCYCGHVGCYGQGKCPLVGCYHHWPREQRPTEGI
jgi:hypothetical protein